MIKKTKFSPPIPGGVVGPSRIATINPPDGSGLTACVEDARRAALDSDPGPAEPTIFHQLRGRLEAARNRLPPLYRDTFVQPFIRTLDALGEQSFNFILIRDPKRERLAGQMMDQAQAILQQAEGFAANATDGFQEVVSDLYDGFLSAEDRRGVSPPDKGVIPPLVKWGAPDFGPYTWPVDSLAAWQVKAGVVSLPPANIRRGLLAWSALSHETAGHDVLHADTGLAEELAGAVAQKVQPVGNGLADYWASRIDETASDVLGILNMGPAAGIGLIGYFRGLSAAFGGGAKLRSDGDDRDPHPADILRGYLAAETVNLLKFTGRTKWRDFINAETDKDLDTIVLGDTEVSPEDARKSCRLVAETLVNYKAQSLEGHSLGEIQNWRDSDERKVRRARQTLRSAVALPQQVLSGTYAAHVVAAAVVEALSDSGNLTVIFDRMLGILKTMHDANDAWGPLFMTHPGNLDRHVVYMRYEQDRAEGGETENDGERDFDEIVQRRGGARATSKD